MGEKVDTQAGGRQSKPAKAARGKRHRVVLVALGLLAVGVGTWAIWHQLTKPEEITLDLGNNVTMRVVLIPAGTFMMGSPDAEPGRGNNEGPQHEVMISGPFYMGVFEVTQEQYEQVMGRNPSTFKGATNPVEGVYWDDAAEFCKKLSEKTGKRVALPTEAQWEYACRAGTTTPFNTGDDLKEGQANAVFPASNPGAWGRVTDWLRKLLGIKAKAAGAGTRPVGSFPPNAFGLYDMHGNVWEWCADWHGDDYYANSPKIDPQGPNTSDSRILRGGSWGGIPVYCRSAYRWTGPDDRRRLGFRVAVASGLD